MSKSKNALAPVSAKFVRAAFRDGTLDASKVVDAKGNAVNTASLFGASGDSTKVRGRIHPAFVAAFNESGLGTYAEKSVAEKNMVTVPLNSPKTGRPIKPVSLPIGEVRVLAGIVGKKGRISSADLANAGRAYQKANAKA